LKGVIIINFENKMLFKDYFRISGIPDDRVDDLKSDLARFEAIYNIDGEVYVNPFLYEESILHEVDDYWVRMGGSAKLSGIIAFYGIINLRLVDTLKAIQATWVEFGHVKDYQQKAALLDRIKYLRECAGIFDEYYFKTLDLMLSVELDESCFDNDSAS
jgi:hypothetical protein